MTNITANSSLEVEPSFEILGMHRIVPMAFAGHDMMPLWNALMARIEANPADAAAMHDLAMMMQAGINPQAARSVLEGAVSLQKNFCVVHGDGSGLRLLAFVTPGDFMANIPVDFLLNYSNCVLWLHYVDADTQNLSDLPAHDVALMAIGEAPEHAAVLSRMAQLLPAMHTPLMNDAPLVIAKLTRDDVSEKLSTIPSILAPRQSRVARPVLELIARGGAALKAFVPGHDFPIVIRPVGTHAGGDLERIRDEFELGAYLQTVQAEKFFVAPFIDYRGADGFYNKQRVVLINGKPFASHMALSDHWIVHYLSAGMREDAAKRAVEAHWMENFDNDFALRHAESFEALYDAIGLDYFGIDCAEMPDGRLLVFEVDVAMIVHDMDDADIFPYKKVAMRKLFNAFVEAATQKSRQAKAAAA